jgi:hypothetical protein
MIISFGVRLVQCKKSGKNDKFCKKSLQMGKKVLLLGKYLI